MRAGIVVNVTREDRRQPETIWVGGPNVWLTVAGQKPRGQLLRKSKRLSRSIISSERNDRKMVKMKKKGKTGPRHIPAAPLHGDWQERLRRRTEQREFIRTACENPRGNCCINVKKLLSIRRHDPRRTQKGLKSRNAAVSLARRACYLLAHDGTGGVASTSPDESLARKEGAGYRCRLRNWAFDRAGARPRGCRSISCRYR